MRILSTLLYIIFLVLMFYFVNEIFKNSRKERKDFSLKGELTIGVITLKGRGHSKSVQYEYIVKDKQLRRGDSHYYMDPNGSDIFDDKEKSKEGKKFLVIYDANNPKESIIRLDYPIKDSMDFKLYVKEFEQIRKQKHTE
jgi:hypothetical protein